MTKSPLNVAKEAYAVGQRALPTYASRFSRKDYTLPQLFALLVLRRFLRTDLRGIAALTREWSELREALELSKTPDHSTLWHVERKLSDEKKRNRSFPLAAKALASEG